MERLTLIWSSNLAAKETPTRKTTFLSNSTQFLESKNIEHLVHSEPRTVRLICNSVQIKKVLRVRGNVSPRLCADGASIGLGPSWVRRPDWRDQDRPGEPVLQPAQSYVRPGH